jgi:hypothetical protein
MKTNPGGEIAPSEVIGRDELVKRLWHVLGRQSLVLSAERRMGKTCIIKKMVAESSQNKLPIYRDLEGVRSPLEFVETVFQDVERYLSGFRRVAERTRQLAAQLGGTEIGGILKLPEIAASHWKTLLTKVLEDLAEHQDQSVIFFWDEMPLMLYNIKQHGGETAAMEVLDVLRSLRQMHPQLRMVFTGSIGLHNVLNSLKSAGYVNDPTNDMYTVDVPPLSLANAQELARQLLKGERVAMVTPWETAQAIAVGVDCIPYFVHHVVGQLVCLGEVVTVETVRNVINGYLIDPQDPWHLCYYRERINTYYSSAEQDLALTLLDLLAVASQPLTWKGLLIKVQSNLNHADAETTRAVLTLLQRDHYITQQSDSKFYFRFPLIQRCWKLHRGLVA